MKGSFLPDILRNRYDELKANIKKRLEEFKDVPERIYFYEMCYCICTPQSKAANAFIVQKKLEEGDFYNNPFNPVAILRNPANYIRFHNQKAERLYKLRGIYPEVLSILKNSAPPFQKRIEITSLVNGFGLKETSHFMRNIGYMDFAILDRHILKHMAACNIYKEIPKVSSTKQYLAVEKSFIKFAEKINIPPEELDVLFWAYETGEILK